jgi:hypothetical protein
MDPPINNVIEYSQPLPEKEFRRRRFVLILSAAISFGMALGGYAIMVYYIFK